jgi:hypothetical protein
VVDTWALPALRGALGVAGDANTRRATAAAAADVWAAVDAIDAPPPPPAEGTGGTSSRSAGGAGASGGSAGANRGVSPAAAPPPQKPRAPWPTDAPPPAAFAYLAALAKEKPPRKTSVVGLCTLNQVDP